MESDAWSIDTHVISTMPVDEKPVVISATHVGDKPVDVEPLSDERTDVAA